MLPPKLSQGLRQAVEVASHIHTGLWIADLIGLGGMITVVAGITHRIISGQSDWLMLGIIFVASCSILLLARQLHINPMAVGSPAANRWDWLINLAKEELTGVSGIATSLQAVRLEPANVTPYMDFIVNLCNTLVWPVSILGADGNVECDGELLKGPPQLIGVASPTVPSMQHGNAITITIRQWLDADSLAFVKAKERSYSLQNVRIRAKINPLGRSGHPVGSDMQLNTNMLKARL